MKDFDAQARAFGDRIEAEIAGGHLSFPTALDVSLRIKRLADSPASSLEEIAAVAKTEPVLGAKTVRMANAVALNPYASEITNVVDAVRRIGLASLRCLAFAVAAEQLAQDHRSQKMRTIASGLWMHSVDVAAWSHALARELRVVNPDTAMFAGMMADIGQFLLLARAADYPALEDNLPRFAEFVTTWSNPVSKAVLEVFELPETILDTFDCSTPYSGSWPPGNLADLLFVASLAVETPNPFDKLLGLDHRAGLRDAAPHGIDPRELDQLLDAARESRQLILAALCS
ncbi:HDOD domain-containing protein [Azoarcus sp. DN11]|uniref:HDOD domain-containing protein n=1 Tax=Azoarcus sp. DN11 TaxID=356837 RepID=UPI000EAEBB59|nr:HDOD domain-containing protein [Azoarcus sp. DN11]AYH44889.1 histidine kinase [Azoarcus sp. DN11]